MKNIVWMSRHNPTTHQVEELNRLYPDCRLIIDHRSFDNVDEIVRRFHSYNGDEMIVVAPLTVVRELVRRGIQPLRAEMKQVPYDSPEAETRYSGRAYKFLRYRRITDIHVRMEDLEAPSMADTDTASTEEELEGEEDE